METLSAINRPVNLLCLSDLHLDSESGLAVINQLQDVILQEVMGDDVRWSPDFIVLAGDLVDGSSSNRKKRSYYKKVQLYLNSFLEKLHLNHFHVIAVPGNHDKSISCWKSSCYYRSSRCKECHILDKYAQFKKASKEERRFEFNIAKEFDSDYHDFGVFYGPYAKKSDMPGEVLLAPDLFGRVSHSALTSGIKVFPSAKICFLCVNTEWAYFPDVDRLFDDGFLCPPVIKSSLDTYYNDFRDYTLVTVMHRNPSELSWETRFRLKPYMFDVLGSIYQYSDVILTGHNHTERLLVPDFMANHAQLFQLGPASVKSRDATLPQYHASLLHIDSLSGNVSVCNLRYNYKNHHWDWGIDQNNYPITPYSSMVPFDASLPWAESIVIPLSSFRDEEIENALLTYFPDLAKKFSFYYKGIQEYGLEEWITSICASKRKAAVFIYSLSKLDHCLFESIKKKLLQNPSFRYALIRQEIVLMEIWFKCRNPQEALNGPSPR